MAAFDLEEQETLDEIKAWWAQYGRWVKLALAGLLIAVAVFSGWRWWQNRQQNAAGELYFQFEAAFDGRDTVKVRELTDKLVAEHPRSPYTWRAQILAARREADSGKIAEAEKRLQTVIDGSNEPMLRDMARLRLASLLLDERKHEAALKLLEKPELPQNGRLFDDRRGDIYVGLGKNKEAREALQRAYDAATKDSAFQAWIQIKLDGLAGEAQ